MSFTTFEFHPQIMAGVEAQGYTAPTPIQEQAMPPALQGRDVLGLAQTGTGKTAAFALPILQRLIKGPRGCIRALVVAPTRELAEQIHESFVELGKKTGLRSGTVYGGVSMVPQMQKLRGRAEIIVACPGRLLDHIGQGNVDFSKLEVLVLDEADRMFDMGFLPDIRRLLSHLPKARQTMLFSATMPDDIRRLANEVLNDPVTVQIKIAEPLNSVAHALYPVMPDRKSTLLLELLKHTDTDSVLVFTRTKHRARKLADHLYSSGYKTTSLQGNMSQNARQAAMQGFREGRYKIMVATDIAARGIDVSQISHVINYDIPDTADAYTHRIGRTGRAAKTGDAFTLVTYEDMELVRDIESVLGKQIERRWVEGFDKLRYDTPVPGAPSQPRLPSRVGGRPPMRGGRPVQQGQRRADAPVPPRNTVPRAMSDRPQAEVPARQPASTYNAPRTAAPRSEAPRPSAPRPSTPRSNPTQSPAPARTPAAPATAQPAPVKTGVYSATMRKLRIARAQRPTQ